MRARNEQWLESVKWRLIGVLGRLCWDLLFWSLRTGVTGYRAVAPHVKARKCIYAFWHSRLLVFGPVGAGRRAAFLVSQSKDGEILAQALQRKGHLTIRGSSSKDGRIALDQLIAAAVTKARPAAIVPDGPRGPRRKAKPGVIILAKKTGYPIIPVTYSAGRAKVFASWDRFMLPYPLARCRIVFGAPLWVPSEADRASENRILQQLEDELNRITLLADRSCKDTTR